MSIFSPAQLTKLREVRTAWFDTLKKPCKLYYQPTISSCSQCLLPVNSDYLGNVGRHGGPMGSMGGICSVCGGSGKIQSENTETVYLVINWNPKLTPVDANAPVPNIRIPYDIVLVEGLLTDLPKLQQAIEIHLDMATSPITGARYNMLNDGADGFSIIPGKYFVVSLKRVS